MPTKTLLTVDGVYRNVKGAFITVDSTYRKVKKAFITVDGVYRQFWEDGVKFFTRILGGSAGRQITTMHDSFSGYSDGVWRFYVHATCAESNDNARAQARVEIRGDDLAGKTITVTYKGSGRSDGYWTDNTIMFFRDGSDSLFAYKTLYDTEEERTVSYTIPDETGYITIGCSYGAKGTGEMEVIISSLTIGEKQYV